ncbi:MAG: RNA polymerase sigma-54 factor, partial [Rhodospirillaceae bacterium]
TPRLDLRQSQTLVMTPQLQQTIKLLQLSNLDLVAFVEQQLESNPLLERASAEAPILEAEGMADARERPEAPVLDALPGTASEAPVDHAFNTDRDEQGPSDGVGTSSADGATGADGAEDGSLSWSSSTGSGGAGGSFDEDGGAGLEAMLSEATTLSDHIEAQIGVDITDGADRLIALHLAGQLEETGWLSGSLDDAAAMLGCPLADVERVLARLQRMDPPGVFARSLAECLALQLADRDRLDPAMAALLANLDRLAKREFTQLMQICGVDKEDLLDMIQEIRALDPKPGLRFQHETVQTMVPDVVMRPDPAADTAEGGWLVELNTETLPRVLVNMRYFARLNRGRRDKDAKTFITEQLQSANWLVK